ncbi:MAG: hypothetical protein ACRDRH_13465 [Pseudonocardia sp.]
MSRAGSLHRLYGAGPLHLLSLLGCFAVAGYAASRVLAEGGPWPALLTWFVGAAIAHDLVLYPLYAIADSTAHARLFRRCRRPPSVRGVPWINYLRVPVGLSALLLLLWFPLILGGREDAFFGATGLSTDVYLGRWLAITGALFLGSAVGYAGAIRRAGRRVAPEPGDGPANDRAVQVDR